MGTSFENGVITEAKGKGKYKFKISSKYRNTEIKGLMSELVEKLSKGTDTLFENLKKIDTELKIGQSIEISPEVI